MSRAWVLTPWVVAAGAAAGGLCWRFQGCTNGCAITGSPVNSSTYGAFMGGLLFHTFKKQRPAGEGQPPNEGPGPNTEWPGMGHPFAKAISSRSFRSWGPVRKIRAGLALALLCAAVLTEWDAVYALAALLGAQALFNFGCCEAACGSDFGRGRPVDQPATGTGCTSTEPRPSETRPEARNC